METLGSIIHRVQMGNQAAYAEVVRRFQDMAIGYARAMLGDADLAEDAAQEAFIEAYVELGQLREPVAFPGWFRRIVYKRCDRLLRQRHPPVVPLDETHGAESHLPAVEQDRFDLLQEAIQQLPLEERALINLFYLRQFTLTQIAEFLDVPATTLNNRLHRARTHLRKELFAMTETQQPPRDPAFTGRVQEQIEALTTLHDALTQPMADILSEALNREVDVRVESVNHTLAFKVVQWFPYPSCTYSFQPEGTQQRIFFDIHMELAAAIVGRDMAIGDEIRVVDLGQLSAEEFPKIHP